MKEVVWITWDKKRYKFSYPFSKPKPFYMLGHNFSPYSCFGFFHLSWGEQFINARDLYKIYPFRKLIRWAKRQPLIKDRESFAIGVKLVYEKKKVVAYVPFEFWSSPDKQGYGYYHVKEPPKHLRIEVA
jgi:hypothetical protein